LSLVTPDDLVRYGMIPEFVGRFPSVVTLAQLKREDMMRILTDVKNNYIEQYSWLFAQDQVELKFSTDSIEALVDRAIASGTGARALHSELERVLLPHMFNLAEYKSREIKCVDISPDHINNPTSL
jgi:ATP-dependent Clp protease ATP-binding subunit ClpX